jgi:hypothetical protein
VANVDRIRRTSRPLSFVEHVRTSPACLLVGPDLACPETNVAFDREDGRLRSCKQIFHLEAAQTRKCSWNPDPTHSGGDRLHTTLSTAARGLEAQECLKRLAGSYSNFRELQRDVQIQTRDSRCCCPLPLYQTGPRNGRFTMVHG